MNTLVLKAAYAAMAALGAELEHRHALAVGQELVWAGDAAREAEHAEAVLLWLRVLGDREGVALS